MKEANEFKSRDLHALSVELPEKKQKSFYVNLQNIIVWLFILLTWNTTRYIDLYCRSILFGEHNHGI